MVALTGAGISVESGIPDFRSPGGLWEVFDPAIYATIDTFLTDPGRSWELFLAVGETLKGKEPNDAHLSLARLEKSGRVRAVITQNIDGLHQKAGSMNVIEVHGDHRSLHCLKCGRLYPADPDAGAVGRAEIPSGSEGFDTPACERCRFPLKPNVVLFGEAVRHIDLAIKALRACDALLVIGTSAQVYPVASFPHAVKERGGTILEFNVEETPLTRTITDYFLQGKASRTLPFIEWLLTKA